MTDTNETSETNETTDGERTPDIDTGEMVRRPTDGDSTDDFSCGVWVGHYDDDPDGDLLEIQNVWCDATVRCVAIPKSDVQAVIDALERRR
ncbi:MULTISPECIES: hypothetical protein [Halorussus]|uniref:hypothetical protein n=1 Tax=Halorussus TaxID=1070314 RepID=UPI00209DE286|nr:hypothetical protein [Halorussus vallis]USZ74264.1 hypothetical protein NGM07_12510 [Halorussus vallis]